MFVGILAYVRVTKGGDFHILPRRWSRIGLRPVSVPRRSRLSSCAFWVLTASQNVLQTRVVVRARPALQSVHLHRHARHSCTLLTLRGGCCKGPALVIGSAGSPHAHVVGVGAHHIALRQQQLRQVAPILAGHSSDECYFTSLGRGYCVHLPCVWARRLNARGCPETAGGIQGSASAAIGQRGSAMLYGSTTPRTATCNTTSLMRSEQRPQEREVSLAVFEFRVSEAGLPAWRLRGGLSYMVCCCNRRCIKAMSETLSTP